MLGLFTRYFHSVPLITDSYDVVFHVHKLKEKNAKYDGQTWCRRGRDILKFKSQTLEILAPTIPIIQQNLSIKRPHVSNSIYSVCNTGFQLKTEVSCCFKYHKIRLISFNRHHLPVLPGGDDRPALSRLSLLPHWVLGLPSAVRLPSGGLWGWPSSSRRRPILTAQNQGGAERRCSQEEGKESRVGRRSELVKLHLTRPHGLRMMAFPIPF